MLLGAPKATTYEKKNGFLLIETFRKTKLWPPAFDPWWPFLIMQGKQEFRISAILNTPEQCRKINRKPIFDLNFLPVIN